MSQNKQFITNPKYFFAGTGDYAKVSFNWISVTPSKMSANLAVLSNSYITPMYLLQNKHQSSFYFDKIDIPKKANLYFSITNKRSE